MGTEVIRSCVSQMIDRKMEKLLLKVVTLGGVADQEKIKEAMTLSRCPLNWVNFQCSRDYAVCYLFKAVNLGGNLIGEKGVIPVKRHDIKNIEVSDFVTGHTNYRKHLYRLILLAGIHHE